MLSLTFISLSLITGLLGFAAGFAGHVVMAFICFLVSVVYAFAADEALG